MSTGQGNPVDLVKHWTPRDWMVVGGGLVAFIFSFFDYVGVSLGSFGSYTTGAWHSYAVLGLLLLFATAVGWALRALGTLTVPPLPAKFEVIAASAAGLGTLLIIIRAAAYPSPIAIHFGGIVLVIAGFVMTGGAVWALSAGSAVAKSGGSGSTGTGFRSGFSSSGRPPSNPPQAPPASPPSSGFPPPAPPTPPT